MKGIKSGEGMSSAGSSGHMVMWDCKGAQRPPCRAVLEAVRFCTQEMSS